MTTQTNAQLVALITNYIASSTRGGVTAAKLREVLQNMLDSGPIGTDKLQEISDSLMTYAAGGLTITGLATKTIVAAAMTLSIAGYATAGDGGACELVRSASTTPTAWNIASADGAYWQLQPKDGAINVKSIGAKGDGLTRDDTAFTSALAAASALGARYVDVHRGTYNMRGRVDQSNYSGIEFRCHRNATLDFSTVDAPWENSTYNGLIYASGTKSTGYGIVAKAYRKTHRINVSSITVAAGVATVECGGQPHGISTDDYVHVGGQTSSTPANEKGLYSQPFQPFGVTGSKPFKVTVIDSDTFTYPTTATANLTGSAEVYLATDVIELDTGLGANFASGDAILINANVELTGGGSTVKDGELSRVKAVYGDLIVLNMTLEVDVDPLNSPLAYKVTMPTGIGITGDPLIIGRGYNPALTGSYYGQVGVRYSYCDRAKIEIRASQIDQTAAELRSCLYSHIIVDVVFGYADEGGRTTGLEKIQYGASLANACRGCVIKDSIVYGGRHGAIISHTSAEPGRSWGCRITNCEFTGTWYASVNTQNTNGSLWVDHCRFSSGRAEAINTRAGRVYIHHNEAINCQSFLSVYRRPEGVHANDNTVIGCSRGAVELADSFEPGFWPDFVFINNDVDGAEYGVYFRPVSTLGSYQLKVKIKGNTFSNIGRNGVYLRTYNSGGVTQTITGDVSGNDFDTIGTLTSSMGIRVENGVNMRANNNDFVVGSGTLSRGVYFEGSGSSGNRALNNTGPGISPLVDFATGSGHRGDDVSQYMEAATNTAETLYPRVWCTGKIITFSGDVSSIDTTGSRHGDVVTLMRTSGSPVIKTSGGNIRLAGSINLTVTSTNTTVTLINRSNFWYEIGRAVA